MAAIRKFQKIEESKLFQRLKKTKTNNDTSRDQLVANVRTVVEQAESITAQINRHMHQYTLHEKTHLWNVLSIMEALLPDKTITSLSPLECALCIMAAFTHDIGMAMPDDELNKYLSTYDTPESREWQGHCDGYAEEWQQIQIWKNIRDNDCSRESEASERIKYLEGFLLAEFIRKRHAYIETVMNWLTRMEVAANKPSLFHYGNFDFKRNLAQIGISHGHDVWWLREQLVAGRKQDEFCKHPADETVNLAFPGLLTRLADIMDFDASRTPSILFSHFGIEDKLSIQEWSKHMAITGRYFDGDNLIYEADACKHPVHEKAIREFVKLIEHEIRQVRGELSYQQDLLRRQEGERYKIRLPIHVDPKIAPALDGTGKPVYISHNLAFSLDKTEIQQLLMGESLYGDPSLCLRELIQNSLDALQMRDLRLKVLDIDSEARVEPTDSLCREEELQVKVTWGRDADTDREYIRVSDTGCGMTKDTLERFFAKLGKSYYRSPEYEREQQIFRQHGHVVSPISQFGIGFMSCFMLADEIHLKTRPGGANANERSAYDVVISGPGNLFWLKQGSLKRQGTEITLFLKPRFRLAHDWDRTIGWLRIYFGGTKEAQEASQRESQAVEQQGEIDPAWHVGRCAIWPMFPILLGPNNGSSLIRLDDRFYWDVLTPIDRQKLDLTATDCEIPLEALGQPRWECLDWQDNQGGQASGTRIRLVFPYHQPCGDQPLPLDPADTTLVRAHELAALVETTVEINEVRKRLAIRGMSVDNLAACDGLLPASAGVGTWLWVDLRGTVAPQLTADRKTALNRENREEWAADILGVFRRWSDWLQTLLNEHSPALVPGLLSAFALEKDLRPQAPATPSVHLWQLVASGYFGGQTAEWCGAWVTSLFIQEISVIFSFFRDLNFENFRENRRHDKRFYVSEIELNQGNGTLFDTRLANTLSVDLIRDNKGYWRNDVSQLRNSFFPVIFMNITDPAPKPNPEMLKRNLLYKSALMSSRIRSCLGGSLFLHLLPEAFADDLSRSLPALGLAGLKGRAGDGWLKAPGWIEWDVDPVTAEIRPNDQDKNWPTILIEKNYDLVFPLSHIPLGDLRRNCPKWRSDRSFRAIGVLPFFMLGSGATIQQREALHAFFDVPKIHALMPKPELWLKPFNEWTESDWNTGCLSALWNLESGCVYWAEGTLSAYEMPQMGKLIDEFIHFEE